MRGVCDGNSEGHCCWLRGKVCDFLEEGTVDGRRWACRLRREKGDWDAVLASDDYKIHVEPILGPLGLSCKTWPTDRCNACGYVADGT